ncbi:hypothetical protein KsCSTR_06130 [Candidatus Kuenenia stuttgartiensis]|uniref:Uncharacterized protein n=1 Tax=Kuenenia stuttgartiensis TaxID=174633 RepID=Q1PZW4_KUEST|nr:hypothetical protein KsCSTR_06130 [Candidatus Kuenenia stuttgartiensis]CAJ72630.1 unknown protein [Candidatus Kuenenia stuttgartiensis]
MTKHTIKQLLNLLLIEGISNLPYKSRGCINFSKNLICLIINICVMHLLLSYKYD